MRTSGPSAHVLDAALEVIRAFDSDIAITGVGSLEGLLAETTARERLTLVLMLTFASVTFALVFVGIYGVVSVALARQVPEFGVRMALGARPGGVALGVLGRGLGPALVGSIAGVGLASVTGRAIESLLYGATVRDPATYIASTLGLLSAILTACAIPALRTLRIDPVRALHSE